MPYQPRHHNKSVLSDDTGSSVASAHFKDQRAVTATQLALQNNINNSVMVVQQKNIQQKMNSATINNLLLYSAIRQM